MPRQKRSNAKRENSRAQEERESVDFQAAPRAAQALRLRRLGLTYQDIADRVGYKNESSARTAVKNASRRIIRDEARELVGWQLDQLDIALNVVLHRIQRNDEYSLWAVDRLVPLLKRQSELMGLDAPKPESVMAQQMTLVSVPIAADVLEAI